MKMSRVFCCCVKPSKPVMTREESLDLSMIEGAVVSQAFFTHPQDKNKVIPVGMKILSKNGRHIITSVTRNTLADRLCLRRMDILHQVNQLKVGHWPHNILLLFIKNLLCTLGEEEELKMNIEVERFDERTIRRNLESIHYYTISGVFSLHHDVIHVRSTIFSLQNLTDNPNNNFIRFTQKYFCQIQNVKTKRYLIAQNSGLKFQMKGLNQPDNNDSFLLYEYETADYVPVVMLFSESCRSFVYCTSADRLGLLPWPLESDEVKTQNHTDVKTFYLRNDGSLRTLNPSSAYTRFMTNSADSEDVILMETLANTKPASNMLYEIQILKGNETNIEEEKII